MLLSIDFPFVDTRSFLENDVGLLRIPNWPAAIPDQDFVRSFGIIRKRPLGGLPGWIGENPICNARRALRFAGPPTFCERLDDSVLAVRFAVAYRRLYFDGFVSGKYSVGLSSRYFRRHRLSRRTTRNLFQQLLCFPVTVRDPCTSAMARTPLWGAGKLLAELYANSTTRTSHLATHKTPSVLPIPPFLFLLLYSDEEMVIPFPGYRVPCDHLPALCVSKYSVPIGGTNHPLWVIVVDPKLLPDFSIVRDLRIGLSRLYTEYSSLLRVLRSIANDDLIVTPRGDAAQRLQRYLEHSFGVISRKEARVEEILEPETVELARETFELGESGWSNAVVTSLHNIDIKLRHSGIRLNLRRNMKAVVDRIVIAKTYIEEADMRRPITIGDVTGSVVNIDSTLEQVAQTISSSGTLDDAVKRQLAEQIEELKAALRQVPATRREETDAVADSARVLVEAGTKAQPNRKTVQITADGLKKAAESIADVMPTVVAIASNIVKTVLQITGVPLP